MIISGFKQKVGDITPTKEYDLRYIGNGVTIERSIIHRYNGIQIKLMGNIILIPVLYSTSEDIDNAGKIGILTLGYEPYFGLFPKQLEDAGHYYGMLLFPADSITINRVVPVFKISLRFELILQFFLKEKVIVIDRESKYMNFLAGNSSFTLSYFDLEENLYSYNVSFEGGSDYIIKVDNNITILSDMENAIQTEGVELDILKNNGPITSVGLDCPDGVFKITNNNSIILKCELDIYEIQPPLKSTQYFQNIVDGMKEFDIDGSDHSNNAITNPTEFRRSYIFFKVKGKALFAFVHGNKIYVGLTAGNAFSLIHIDDSKCCKKTTHSLIVQQFSELEKILSVEEVGEITRISCFYIIDSQPIIVELKLKSDQMFSLIEESIKRKDEIAELMIDDYLIYKRVPAFSHNNRDLRGIQLIGQLLFISVQHSYDKGRKDLIYLELFELTPGEEENYGYLKQLYSSIAGKQGEYHLISFKIFMLDKVVEKEGIQSLFLFQYKQIVEHSSKHIQMSKIDLLKDDYGYKVSEWGTPMIDKKFEVDSNFEFKFFKVNDSHYRFFYDSFDRVYQFDIKEIPRQGKWEIAPNPVQYLLVGICSERASKRVFSDHGLLVTVCTDFQSEAPVNTFIFFKTYENSNSVINQLEVFTLHFGLLSLEVSVDIELHDLNNLILRIASPYTILNTYLLSLENHRLVTKSRSEGSSVIRLKTSNIYDEKTSLIKIERSQHSFPKYLILQIYDHAILIMVFLIYALIIYILLNFRYFREFGTSDKRYSNRNRGNSKLKKVERLKERASKSWQVYREVQELGDEFTSLITVRKDSDGDKMSIP